MNRQELKAQVMRRLFVGKTVGDQFKGDVVAVMDDLLKHYAERDRLAAERGQAPFNFDAKAVTWLERAVRMKVKL